MDDLSPNRRSKRRPPKPIVQLLEKYYQAVLPLGEYLHLKEDTFEENYLGIALVGISEDEGLRRKKTGDYTKGSCPQEANTSDKAGEEDILMAQVIDSAQSILLWRSTCTSKSKGNSDLQNVLTLGCKLGNDSYPELAIPVIMGPFSNQLVIKYLAFDNTVNNFLCQSYFFGNLLKIIGPKAMVQLLTNTAIYFPAENGCYFQVCGQPIHDINTLLPSKTVLKPYQRNDMIFSKSSLMYAKMSSNKTGKLKLGLSPSHVLNQIRDPKKEFREDYFKSSHLSKYIFPSLYSLPLFNYLNHDKLIENLAKSKTPGRLKPLLRADGLIGIVTTASSVDSVEFNKFLNKTCPKKFINSKLTDAEKMELVELSESATIYSLGNQNSLEKPFSKSQSTLKFAQPSQLSKPSSPTFSQFTCSHYEIQRFLWVMICRYGLFGWWGIDSKHNKAIVKNNIHRILKLRRFEKITLHELLQGFKTKECGRWLTQYPSDKISEKMLNDFVWWFYVSFIGELVKNTFFVTESAIFKNRTLYFRHDDWQSLCTPLVNHLKNSLFQKVEMDESAGAISKLGHSSLRLLPKDNGVRPIVNLKRKRLAQGGQSNNTVLQNLFTTLTYEKNCSPGIMGASVLGLNEIYTRFKQYRSNMGTTLPRFYFVKVDIQACFDSIQQNKILQVIEDLLSEDQYVIQKYAQLSTSLLNRRKIVKKFKRQAYASGESPEFVDFVEKMSKTLKNVIFSDQVKYPYSDKEALVRLLREHITENHVKIGNHKYRQKVGIPQGSILSPLLCSLFYADMDRSRLGFTKNLESIMVRLIDDFLYITTSQKDAERFLRVMAEGSKEYGCFVSIGKTLVNFEFKGVNVLVGNEFPWCGHLINTETLEFKVDLSRYHSNHISDSLTVERTNSPGEIFRQKMYQMVKLRINMIYIDTELNSKFTVLLNIYQAFRLMTAKYVAYLNDWGADTIRGSKFCHNVIEGTIKFFCISAQRQASQNFVQEVGGKFSVRTNEITWLGRKAFKSGLDRRKAKFYIIIKKIEHDLENQKKKSLNRSRLIKLEAVIRSKANYGLKGIKY